MTIFKLSLWRIKKQIVSQLLLVVQLIFLFTGIMLTVSALQDYSQSYRVYRKIDGFENACYWTMNVDYFYQTGGDQDFESYLANMEDRAMEMGYFSGIGNVDTKLMYTEKGNYDLQIYNTVMAENIRLPLKEGNWFSSDAQSDCGEMIVDATMAKKYPVGSVVEGTFEYYDFDTGEDVCVTMSFRVIGILDMDGYIFDLLTGGSSFKVSDMLNTVSGYAIVQKSAETDQLPASNLTETRIAFFSPSADREKAMEILGNAGDAQSFENIEKQTIRFILYRIGYDFPLYFVLIVLGLMGLGGSLIVSFMVSRRENAIYSICGIKNRELIAVEWLRCGIVAIIAGLIAFLMRKFEVFGGYFALSTYLMSMSIAAILIVLALTLASTQVRSVNPIADLRRND